MSVVLSGCEGLNWPPFAISSSGEGALVVCEELSVEKLQLVQRIDGNSVTIFSLTDVEVGPGHPISMSELDLIARGSDLQASPSFTAGAAFSLRFTDPELGGLASELVFPDDASGESWVRSTGVSSAEPCD